jgi:ElaA protein
MNENQIKVICKPFSDLSIYELYSIIHLRNEVFVVEQKCIFQDADEKDSKCHHLMLLESDKLIGYSRLIPSGISYDEISIGRIAVSINHRGKGLGKLLVEQSLNYCQRLFGSRNICIGAQYYLKSFYEHHGFVQISEVYLDDGIEHIDMMKLSHSV